MIRPGEAVVFLRALWDVLDTEGYVELRPLYPQKPEKGTPGARRQGRARRWLPLEELIARLPSALSWCAEVGVSAYFGVLPRRSFRAGGARDVLSGAVAWVDLDLPVHGCRERLARVPFRPSAVVLTGRGVHAYWLLSEPEPAEVCSGLSERLARAVGGDRAWDSARLLRLPGSVNVKHAHRPVARLARLEVRRRYHAVDLADGLPEAPTRRRRKHATNTQPKLRPEQLGLALRRRVRYARGTLGRLEQEIRRTGEGDRNSALFRAGARCGELAAAGGLGLDEARRRLVAAGCAVGLDEVEAAGALENGIARGLAGEQ